MNRSDLQRLSNARIREAKILFAAGEYSGAYYLAGYAVECALKACIAKATQRFDFPDKVRVNGSYSHKLADLLKIANLTADLEQAVQVNGKLGASWNVVSNWSEQSRYVICSGSDADAMIKAVGKLRDGVIPWIKRRW
jgi:hypothetical protein